MEKRYQVFISSTFADLTQERQAVVQALLSLDHFPAGMEQFPASDDDSWALIKSVIDDSDYYLLVVGGRYGSLNESGISYTEMEFDYAFEKGKPILAFLHAEPDKIPAGKTDQDDKLRRALEKFKDKVKAKHVKHWRNPDELKAQVIQSISAETKRNPQEGWVRANRASDPATVEMLRQEIARLQSENSALKTKPPAHSEQYAQGQDEFEVDIDYRTKFHDEATGSVTVTWDDIFFEVGPTLLEEASETQMKNRLGEELMRYDLEKFKSFAHYPRVANDSFETIKVQLMALGLICKSQKKHVPSDTNRYWSITPYGESTLMGLRAIKKD